jgi:glycosyltransferase involved in cell wall biosynthesis
MKKIAITSHLKPIDDQRHFLKLAISMAKTNKYEVNIIGFGTKNIENNENIQFLSLEPYQSPFINRLVSSLRILKKVIQLKPSIWIGNHPELLIVMIAYRILFGGKIVYDLQENYKLNLIHQHQYSRFFKYIAAYALRAMEYISKPFISGYILAEQVYATQLAFTKSKYVILENKAIEGIHVKAEIDLAIEKPTKFIFTGNISEISGADKAIMLFKNLKAANKDLELKLVGHCPNRDFYLKLLRLIDNDKAITLIVSNEPLPYFTIYNHLINSHLAILAYSQNTSNEGKFPTKYYEYNAYQIPYLIDSDSAWRYLEGDYGISITFKNFNYHKIRQLWLSKQKLNVSNKRYLWQPQEPDLYAFLEKL